ncbi:winged helix DNA-binding domain-containing protein [Allobranchiibius huperziae]|uniref:Winged helix DNA-binding domain-containing protein n=1 Tax=Allobranchiibius huperziae TaxID=1874116 RepID=A0A853DB25_9MICO|nr:winged helix DNA-binding domain-containing protein [Allobranchiibius huperziae]NYJ74148.1 hypothetical protein [Allobranchiibius huperziae]
MSRAVTHQQVARMRLAAQCLAGRSLPTPEDVVRHLTCTQSQDWRACRIALAARTTERSVQAVDAAYDAGRIVRSWPVRGTLHTVLATDLRWMLALTSDRIRAQYATRLAGLGVDAAQLDGVRDLTRELLHGGAALTRRELLDAWTAAGLDVSGQRGAHLLVDLSIDTVVCLGPIRDGVQQFVLCDDWLPKAQPPPDPVTAWARRYLLSHGPAARADFLWWTKLLVREVAPAWEQIVDGLDELTLDGVSLYAAPEVVEAGMSRATLTPLLTAAFDEILLGYADRSATLPARFADHIVPGGNGMFRPVVLDGARAVGTWSAPMKPGAPPRVELFEGPPSRRLAAARLSMPAR